MKREPDRCYGCGHRHSNTALGNDACIEECGCLGFIRGDADAMGVLTGALRREGFDASPGRGTVAVRRQRSN
jgi:hypothetical protein